MQTGPAPARAVAPAKWQPPSPARSVFAAGAADYHLGVEVLTSMDQNLGHIRAMLAEGARDYSHLDELWSGADAGRNLHSFPLTSVIVLTPNAC